MTWWFVAGAVAVGELTGAAGAELWPPPWVALGDVAGAVVPAGGAELVAMLVALGLLLGDADGLLVAVRVGLAVGVPLPAAGEPDELSLSDPLAMTATTPASAITTLRMPSVRMRGEFGPVGVEAATEFLSAC